MCQMIGSSPRGRGKPTLVVMYFTLCGLIPAWAGKTRSPTRQAARSPAHPRVGGENQRRAEEQLALAGSSPRGRGKHSQRDQGRLARRLIPAWAGKTELPPGVEIWESAHPRVGGENLKAPPRPDSIFGSSPRGRGKPDRLQRREQGPGLIPAWAGKTGRACPPRRGCRAHPRVGGENVPHFGDGLLEGGSSPRGRGKRRRDLA